jgi:thymidylate synthase
MTLSLSVRKKKISYQQLVKKLKMSLCSLPRKNFLEKDHSHQKFNKMTQIDLENQSSQILKNTSIFSKSRLKKSKIYLSLQNSLEKLVQLQQQLKEEQLPREKKAYKKQGSVLLVNTSKTLA